MKHFGFGRFPGNPAICQNCISQYRKTGVTGAEIPITLLFADIRGSTGIGERLSPTGFHDFLVYFYRLGSAAILDHGGIVDKLVGDEVIGLFFGGVSGPRHAAAAIEAATDLVARAGRADATPMGPIPIGAGVHTGIAFVGPTGPEGLVDDFTALGDPVNTSARLASAAAAGELLVSVDAAGQAGMDAGRGRPPDDRRPWAGGDDRRRGPAPDGLTDGSLRSRPSSSGVRAGRRRASARSRPGPADAGPRHGRSRPARGAPGSRRCRR